MRRHKIQSRSARRPAKRRQRGIALLTTLLLLMLMTGLSLAMVMSVRSDLLVNSYYRNFRGSFYAADSGLNIVRQDLVNQLEGQVPTSPTPGTAPMPSNAIANVLSYLTTKYGQSNSIASSGSWPESFALDSTQTSLTGGCVSSTVGTCAAPGNNAVVTYTYSYTLGAVGHAQNQESTAISDKGNFNIVVTLTPTTSSSQTSIKTSFAAWGMFINTYSICDGSTLVPGTISGPVFTNGAWNFGTGNYIFTDSVGSVSKDAGYQNGSCAQVAGPSGNGITPTFQQGFNLGQNAVPLPANDYNQKRAVLDGQGTNNNAVTNTDLNSALKNVLKTAYPTGGASSGVFLPYATVDSSGNALATPVFTGGGIYVEGNATVTLAPGSTAAAQVFTIKQGSTTTTITTDPTPVSGFPNGKTVMTQGGTSVTISGVPESRDPSGNALSPDAMLYVDGNVTALSGPGPGLPALQNGEALTITAAQSVTITGDIKYSTEPVTMTANQIPNTPADTLIPANNTGQVLGIFTATGNINLANSQSSGNLEIDASLAMISQGGSGGLVNTGNSINTLNIVGGRIQNTIQNINTTTRNVFFDRRFLSNNFAPPWFPSTSVTPTTVTTVTTESAGFSQSFQRTNWLFKGSTYQ